MIRKLIRSEVRTSEATKLLDKLHGFIYNRPICNNEELLFEEIPLAKYALEAHVPLERTALHKVIDDIAYNYLYVYFYDDLDFDPELLPEIRQTLLLIFNEMRVELPTAFKTDDPDKFRRARDKYRLEFVKGLRVIVDDTFSLAWGMKSLLADFNESLAAKITKMKKSEDDRLVADGRLGRPRYIPAWVVTVLHQRDGGFCQECGRPAIAAMGSDEPPHIDHIVALANGGGNDVTNLQLMCARCNLAKGAKNTSVRNQFAWPEYHVD